jgi:predicted signal transduction protein with EAL and GGDEF domain
MRTGPSPQGGPAPSGSGSAISFERIHPVRPAPWWVYLAVSLPLATATYQLVQVIYLLEQTRAGLLSSTPPLAEIVLSSITVHGVSFALWLVFAGLAGFGTCRAATALHRSQQRVIAAREAEALRDHLTGLYNRRAMEDRLAHLDAFARRSGHPYAVVAIDADGLKRINDTFGHDVGDAAIREVGEALLVTARAPSMTASASAATSSSCSCRRRISPAPPQVRTVCSPVSASGVRAASIAQT